MYNFKAQVKDFLKENFTPATAPVYDLALSNQAILDFLFDVFPKDCISDYDLHEILHDLQYKKQIIEQDGIFKIVYFFIKTN